MTIHNQLDKAAADGGGVLWWVTGGWLHKLIPRRSSNLQQSVQEWEDCGVNVLFKMLCYLGHVKVTYMKNGIRTHNFHRANVPQRTRSLGWIHEPTTICSLQRRSMKKGRCLLFFCYYGHFDMYEIHFDGLLPTINKVYNCQECIKEINIHHYCNQINQRNVLQTQTNKSNEYRKVKIFM